jgi:DNA-binding protein HU-beta
MNNKEFQSALAAKLGISSAEVEELQQAATTALVNELQTGNSINVQGFGSFEVREKEERAVVNPLTKERSIVPAKKALAFKVSAVYKEKIKDTPRL